MITANEMRTLTYRANPMIKYIETICFEEMKKEADRGRNSYDIKLKEFSNAMMSTYTYEGAKKFITEYLEQYGYTTDYVSSSKILRIHW